MDQRVLDAVEQSQANLYHNSPTSDQEAIPDSAHHVLWQITSVERQKPLDRVVLRVHTMPAMCSVHESAAPAD